MFQRISKKPGHRRRLAVIRGNKTTAVEPRGCITRMGDLIAGFRRNRRGNVAIMAGMAAIPMIVAVGCVIDYTMATSAKAKLQAGADAATLAAVSVNSPIVANAKAMNSNNGPVTNGTTYLSQVFQSNYPASPTPSISSSSVNKSGMIVTATLSFTAQVPTSFLGVIGFHNITVTGSSTSSYTMPTYISFYLLLDVSGSMSFPSTQAEQARLQAVNPDNMNPNTPGSNGYPGGCTFACHFTRQGACPQSGSGNGPYQGPIPAVGSATNPSPGGYCQGFIISRLGTTPTSFSAGTNNATNGNNVNWTNTQVTSCSTPGTTACIQLRADAVGYAVNQLLSTAYATEQANNKTDQFKVGLYPFIVQVYNNGSSDGSGYANLTTSINGSATSPGTINYAAAQLATLLDTGNNAALKSGGTNINGALTTANILITSVGGGTSNTDYLPYVFLITDGSQDNQTQWGGSWAGSNHATTVDPTYCTTLKIRGITVAVLYIPYQPIQNPTSFAGGEDYAVNAILPYDGTYNPSGATGPPTIPSQLQACASPNFFYTANTPADINDALVKMFEQAVKTAHVTN
jgi:Flp pilus assembly protein TadG